MSSSALQAVKISVADDLLCGLDIKDEESREFLESLIVAGQVPEDEMKQLYATAIRRDVEEWYMLIECATSLKNQAISRLGLRDDPGVVPYLGYILSGKAAADQAQRVSAPKPEPRRKMSQSSRRRPSKVVSRFWDDEEEEEAGPSDRGHSANTHKKIPAQGVQEARNDTELALQPGSTKSARKRKRALDRRQQQSPESNNGATSSRDRAANSSRDKIEFPPASDQDPGLLLETKQENDDEPTEDKESTSKALPTSSPRPKRLAKSPYFTPVPSPKKPRPPRGTVSSIPFPPLSAPKFGLIQEELAGDPFQLLVAVTFLIRTAGKAAIPVFREFVDRFPTPAAVAGAQTEDIIPMIRHLGLSAVRYAAVRKYARMWLESPPSKDVRYGVRNYPQPGDAQDVTAGGEYGPEERHGVDGDDDGESVVNAMEREAPGTAWEIGHLTQGPYAIDSWRIFCRDVLLEKAEDWMGKGREPTFQPEWMRVLPADKELRACLRWMWMREGWEWDPVSGERIVLREEMRRAVDERRVGYDDHGGLVILPQPLRVSDHNSG